MRFNRERDHGQISEHPWLAGRVYMALGSSHNHTDCGSIHGWVTPAVAAIVEAAPDLLSALQAYVDDARLQSPGKPNSPFAVRLAAAQAAIAKATK